MSHNNAETETAENDNYVKLSDSREAVLWKREVGGGAERGQQRSAPGQSGGVDARMASATWGILPTAADQ